MYIRVYHSIVFKDGKFLDLKELTRELNIKELVKNIIDNR